LVIAVLLAGLTTCGGNVSRKGAKAHTFEDRASEANLSTAPGSIVFMANGEGMPVSFTIRLDEKMVFDCRDGYVGEELKDLLQPGSITEVEMTFHLDHVFGDSNADEEDHINSGSVGFDFFYAFGDHGVVDVCQGDLKKAEGYSTLVQALWNLGHLGEGHCEVSQRSSLIR
jgi:hypothetical protein